MPALRRPAPAEWLELRAPAYRRRRVAPAAPAPVAAAPAPAYNLRPRAAAPAPRVPRGAFAPDLQQRALRGYQTTHRFPGADLTLEAYLRKIRHHVRALLFAQVRAHRTLKAHLVAVVEFDKPKPGGGTDTRMADLRCNAYVISNTGQINKVIKAMEYDVEAQRESVKLVGSNWNERRVDHAWLNTIEWQPIAGGCSEHPLPQKIAAKQACIYIRTADTRWSERCFELALTAWRHPAHDHAQRLNKYDEFFGEWNMEGIAAPVALHDVERFGKQNALRVNVYGLDEQDNVYPLQLCRSPAIALNAHLACHSHSTSAPCCSVSVWRTVSHSGRHVWMGWT